MRDGVKIAAATLVIALLAANLGTLAVAMLDGTAGRVAAAALQPQQPAENGQGRPGHEIAQAAQPAVSGPAVEAVHAPKYEAPCRQPEDHDACDLEAQWKAADAARDAANWGWWQMVIGAFGLGGLLYSLVLTRRATAIAVAATKDADKALEIAARNADAAAAQVEVAREIGRTQVRCHPIVYDVSIRYQPYFGFIKHPDVTCNGIHPEKYCPHLGLKIRNYGRTIAKSVCFTISLRYRIVYSDGNFVEIRKRSGNRKFPVSRDQYFDWGLFIPEGGIEDLHEVVHLPLSVLEVKALGDETPGYGLSAYAVISLRYIDIFDETHVESFAFQSTPVWREARVGYMTPIPLATFDGHDGDREESGKES